MVRKNFSLSFGVEIPTQLLQWLMSLETHFEEYKIKDSVRIVVSSKQLCGVA